MPELKPNEIYHAQVVFHVDADEINQIIKEEVEETVTRVNERIEQYLLSQFRAEMID